LGISARQIDVGGNSLGEASLMRFPKAHEEQYYGIGAAKNASK